MSRLLSVLIEVLIIFKYSATEITDIRIDFDINTTDTNKGVVKVKFDGNWFSVCHFGDQKIWGKREATVACRQLQFQGGWPLEVKKADTNFTHRHLNNFDCDGTEKKIQNCGYEIAEECIDSKLAGIRCFHSFEVRLVSGVTPNAGIVEVKYDGEWSNVCYESKQSETRKWSFYNVQVLCRELGFLGAMVAGRNGQSQGTRRTIVDGYRCRQDLRETSLKDCFPEAPVMSATYSGLSCGNTSEGGGNDAFAICAVPGYIGCFETNANDHMLSELRLPEMTINICRNHCRSYNFTLAFLHNGDTCFCEFSEGVISHELVGDTKCRRPCSGNSNEVCGDNHTLSVYDVYTGSCDDPLNKTGIYYYADILDEFNCDPGMKLVGSPSIQCVMGNSSDEMKWNSTVPECKAILDVNFHKGFAIAVSVVAFVVLVLLVMVVLFYLRRREARKYRRITKDEISGLPEANVHDSLISNNKTTTVAVYVENEREPNANQDQKAGVNESHNLSSANATREDGGAPSESSWRGFSTETLLSILPTFGSDKKQADQNEAEIRGIQRQEDDDVNVPKECKETFQKLDSDARKCNSQVTSGATSEKTGASISIIQPKRNQTSSGQSCDKNGSTSREISKDPRLTKANKKDIKLLKGSSETNKKRQVITSSNDNDKRIDVGQVQNGGEEENVSVSVKATSKGDQNACAEEGDTNESKAVQISIDSSHIDKVGGMKNQSITMKLKGLFHSAKEDVVVADKNDQNEVEEKQEQVDDICFENGRKENNSFKIQDVKSTKGNQYKESLTVDDSKNPNVAGEEPTVGVATKTTKNTSQSECAGDYDKLGSTADKISTKPSGSGRVDGVNNDNRGPFVQIDSKRSLQGKQSDKHKESKNEPERNGRDSFPENMSPTGDSLLELNDTSKTFDNTTPENNILRKGLNQISTLFGALTKQTDKPEEKVTKEIDGQNACAEDHRKTGPMPDDTLPDAASQSTNETPQDNVVRKKKSDWFFMPRDQVKKD